VITDTREVRRRLLPARLVVYVVLALWLFRGRNYGYRQVMSSWWTACITGGAQNCWWTSGSGIRRGASTRAVALAQREPGKIPMPANASSAADGG